MKGRNTAVIGVRVPDTLYTTIATLAKKQGITISEWCKTTLAKEATNLSSQGVRRHTKEEVPGK